MAYVEEKPTISQRLLRTYYPVVMSLQGYLADMLQSGRKSSAFLTHETDSMMYRVLLKNSLVCRHVSPIQQRFQSIAPMVALQEVSDVRHRISNFSN